MAYFFRGNFEEIGIAINQSINQDFNAT